MRLTLGRRAAGGPDAHHDHHRLEKAEGAADVLVVALGIALAVAVLVAILGTGLM